MAQPQLERRPAEDVTGFTHPLSTRARLILAARQAGATYAAIAAELGISSTRVQQVVAEQAVRRARAAARLPAERLRHVGDLPVPGMVMRPVDDAPEA